MRYKYQMLPLNFISLEHWKKFSKAFLFKFSTGINLSDAEFIQYLFPVGFGPSLNKWPRWESAFTDLTSIRDILNERSGMFTTLSGTRGRVKEGQPVPDLNLSFELNNGSPETISTYIPACLLSQYLFLKGGSVPFFWVTLYCNLLSFLMDSFLSLTLIIFLEIEYLLGILYFLSSPQNLFINASRPDPVRYIL